MTRKQKRSLASQAGFVVFLFLILAMVLLTSLALGVDIGKAYDNQRQIQIAADAASLAALTALGSETSYSRVVAMILTIAAANGVDSDEVLGSPPRCGRWDNVSFAPEQDGVCRGDSTAIEVTVRRAVPTNFGRLANKPEFNLTARSVGYLPAPTSGNCIRPFGIEQSFLSSLDLQDGGTFSLSGTQESGNWGKIDLNGNSSSGEEYTNLMLHNLCDEQIAAGNSVSSGTGNAAIEQVFETILSDTTTPLASQNMVFAVTTDFGVGNSLVQLLRFIRVDLLSQGGNGQKWRATFKIVELDTQPDPLDQPARQLVQ